MTSRDAWVSDASCLALAVVFVLGLVVLGVRLRAVQIDGTADYSYANARQSVRRVQTDGRRGRILARDGVVLADGVRTVSIVCHAAQFQRRTWQGTEAAISAAVVRVAQIVGRPALPTGKDIARHVNQKLARPLVVWRDVTEAEIARFSEHAGECPGFTSMEMEERRYPYGALAAHALGYVGRDEVKSEAGDEKFNYREREMRGRGGLESYYDAFLRGVPGEEKVLVDARGFAIASWTAVEPQRGPDLKISLDMGLQSVVERELQGVRGACVAIDPRTGEILAFASAPTFDLNRCVPVLQASYYASLRDDPAKPLLNRASGGAYAPGSTFKPVTALAGLSAGYAPSAAYECVGHFSFGGMHLHCARRWGHGPVDLRHALMKSCNPYFCHLGVTVGTNAMMQAASALGLGRKTGIDLGVDMAGAVPDAAWKMKTYREPWFPGDVPQMAIGQGMLLVSPMQMACVIGAIGTGYRVVPHFKRDMPVVRRPLPFSASHLKAVREGLRMVVAGDGDEVGTGRRGGQGVAVAVSGKTGTAEVGSGERRYKNVWFVAYAPSEAPTMAIALVIEHGESGGGTAAPKVAAILRAAFGGDPST